VPACQDIGWKEHLQYDLFMSIGHLNLKSNQSTFKSMQNGKILYLHVFYLSVAGAKVPMHGFLLDLQCMLTV